MKKLYYILSALAITTMLSACTNNDKLIDQYEQAMNEGNYSDARAILSRIDDDRLTEEQTMRLLDISTGGAASSMADMLMEETQELGSALNDEMTDERTDKLTRAGKKSIDEAFEEMDEVLDDYLDD